MLQIREISKEYVTGELHQKALDRVSLNLRENEFVAILGPSGSGKTTLLNVIGGLDRYDSGDLIINGISTKKYRDRDWDSYRNHTIGFVFQSYNLIPHQSVLANVELALTISGIGRSERRRRAKQALCEVGLGDQLHKKPNQMSGGQMQRVAIARALVNNPDILLADEPTGALDTETSLQVMELLKSVAKDRLVVMVTHNPELAQKYATRIVRLSDGRITDDSNPYEIPEDTSLTAEYRNMGKSSMSLRTALSLSFNNLLTKKARTILTSFAGSIGIIGIALILSLSNGVNTYIDDLQKSTMTSYPVTIDAQTMDLSTILTSGQANTEKTIGEADHELDGVYSNPSDIQMASSVSVSIQSNNLTKFKEYLENEDSEIASYIGKNGVVYSYDTKFSVYSYDLEGTFVNTDGSTLNSNDVGSSIMTVVNSMGSGASNSNYEQLLPGKDGELVSNAVKDQYEVLYGSWPSEYDEVVLVVNKNNEIAAATLYQLGILPVSEYKELMAKIDAGQELTLDSVKWNYEDICKQELILIPACDMYKEENGVFTLISGDETAVSELAKTAMRLKIVGVIRPNGDSDYANISSVLAYTKGLTDYLIDYTDQSDVVQAQLANPDIDVCTGRALGTAAEESAAGEAAADISAGTGTSDSISAEAAGMTDGTSVTASGMMAGTTTVSSYDNNMSSFGYVSIDAPTSISIYTDSFENKEAVTDCIDHYNETVEEEDQITYTDYVGLLMSSVTTIVNVISYVLIAFVAVSLVVSSIMIGIITYISVLERTKEIGILRAIGASKRNIAQVFNAETFIIGLCAGLIGIGITLLLLVPGNAIIHAVTGSKDVNAALPVQSAVTLIILSVILTLIGGLIPSKKAARRDPVTALRSE